MKEKPSKQNSVKKKKLLQTQHSTKPLMHRTDQPAHNPLSPKDLFQASHAVLDSLEMAGQHVLMLQGSPGVCPVEADCLTAPALWRK